MPWARQLVSKQADGPLEFDLLPSLLLYLTSDAYNYINVGFLIWRVLVAEKKTQAAKSGDKKKDGLLKKRVNVSGKGKLSKSVRAPRWLRAIGGYFVGSWRELRQVTWPTRKATWGMTLAVLLFTLVLAVIILLLDIGFEQLFKRIIL